MEVIKALGEIECKDLRSLVFAMGHLMAADFAYRQGKVGTATDKVERAREALWNSARKAIIGRADMEAGGMYYEGFKKLRDDILGGAEKTDIQEDVIILNRRIFKDLILNAKECIG